MLRVLLTTAALLFAAFAQAQDAGVSSSGSASSMGDLIKQGYEIKSTVSNGSKLIVFLQKENSAYACEFTSLTNSRCGSIN
ncbi:hypothetical protein [Ciceribacter selenitireducens]|uniref:Uncharacterized protein n=1 Tax=Ciceribacter selenitireducens ATCC BAA-1503 TaxID=1336235 RepID=A0A376AKI9_9HYPH|nr:hypothetical protein [Ciceribacter selenitireducens]SSC68299.1 unnamed protein product [Ciceribacter selenitireducens ATCC BAA-1503]